MERVALVVAHPFGDEDQAATVAHGHQCGSIDECTIDGGQERVRSCPVRRL